MTEAYDLDGKQMHDLETAHAYLQEMLGLPAHYGRNADALFDCLTEISSETMLWISDADAVHPMLNRVFTDAMAENQKLTVLFLEDAE